MWWFDESTAILKIRNTSNYSWISVAQQIGAGWVPFKDETPSGTASVKDTGTTGDSISLCSGADVWTSLQTIRILANQDALRIEDELGRLVMRVSTDPDGNGKIQVCVASGTVKATLTGSGDSRLFLGGDESTGVEVGRINESSGFNAVGGREVKLERGLGSRPKHVWGVWRNKIAEFGYVPGQEVRIQYTGGNTGTTISANSSVVTAKMGANAVALLRPGTFVAAVGTQSSWRAVFRWTVWMVQAYSDDN